MEKWQSTAGPRQTKKANKLLIELRSLARSQRELTGTGAGHAWIVSTPFGTDTPANPRALELLEEIGERYGHTLTRKNCKDVVADLVSAIEAARESMPTIDKRISKTQEVRQQATRDQESAKIRENNEIAERAQAEFISKAPLKAAALIVAESEEWAGDIQTDYHATKTVRRVAIGYRTGAREDFRQLRRAAAQFPPTSHMGPGKDIYIVNLCYSETISCLGVWAGCFAPDNERQAFTTEGDAQDWINEQSVSPLSKFIDGESVDLPRAWTITREKVEHRENYSMGAGNYLKACGRYGSGWAVRSIPFDYSASMFAGLENCIPDSTGTPAVDGVTVTLNSERNGIEIRFPDKPGANVRADLKTNGFRWSRRQGLWYAKQTPERIAYAESLKA